MLATARLFPLAAAALAALGFAHAQTSETRITAVLPNGREIHPAGNWIPLAPYPFALAVRPDGQQIAVPSIGFPFALNIIDGPDSREPKVTRMPAGSENDPNMEVHAGLVYSPDGSLLYVATGDSGKIRAYQTTGWRVDRELSLDGQLSGNNFGGSFAAALVISADGKTLYALDQGNWRIVVIDTERMERVSSIPTGAYPYGLALAPDGKRLYVTNTGLFEYSTVPGADENHALTTGLHFPPFAYPSKEAREGAKAEGKQIRGLGDENSDQGSSLWTYDMTDPEHPAVSAKLRLGARITEDPGDTVGGAAPTGVACDDDAVYVSLTHQDTVAKINEDGTRVLDQAPLSPFVGPRFQDAQGRSLRGVMPSGLVVHMGRLYVAESGINAVAVIDTKTMDVIAHIPVGWNPSAVAFSHDSTTLYVVNTKGKGAGPNGGKQHDPNAPTYVGSLELGSLSAILLGTLPTPDVLTDTVIKANSTAIADAPALPQLKHCFFVIRENRTYDEVLGDIARANGDAGLARFGMDGWVTEEAPKPADVDTSAGVHVHKSSHKRSKSRTRKSQACLDANANGHLPSASHTQPPRAGRPVRHERQLFCRFGRVGGRAPLGDGHQSHAVLQHGVDVGLRWPAPWFAQRHAAGPPRHVRRHRRPHARRRTAVRFAVGAHCRGQQVRSQLRRGHRRSKAVPRSTAPLPKASACCSIPRF